MSKRTEQTTLVAWTLVVYGVVVMFAAIMDVRSRAELPTASSWTLVHLVVLLALSVSLLRGHTWAWWGATVLVVAEILLLLPLAIAVVGGVGAGELMSLLDIVLVTVEILLLAVALWLLVQVRRAPG